MARGLQFPSDLAENCIHAPCARVFAVEPLNQPCKSISDPEPDRRPRKKVGVPEPVPGGGKIGPGKALRIKLFPQRGDNRCDGHLEPAGINRRHRHIDEPCMAVPVGGMQRYLPRQAPQFGQNGVHAIPVKKIEERQPEFAPARNAKNSLGLYEPPGRHDQGVIRFCAEQPRRDVNECGDEQMRRRMLVQAP